MKEIVKAEGESVLSEEVIAIFVEGATAEAGARPPDDAAMAPTAGAVARPTRPEKTPAASPAARKIAAEKAVDLARVDGSGRAGRVTKEDVLRAAEAKGSARAPAPPPALEAPLPPPEERAKSWKRCGPRNSG